MAWDAAPFSAQKSEMFAAEEAVALHTTVCGREYDRLFCGREGGAVISRGSNAYSRREGVSIYEGGGGGAVHGGLMVAVCIRR